MTRIVLFQGKKGLAGLESRGHSGYAEKGEDIVCAAVSALVHALLLGVCEVAKVEGAECLIDETAPLIRITWPEETISQLDLLTRTISLSLKEIESGYPGHISITEVYSS